VHDAKEVWRLTGLAVEWMRQEAPSGSALADRLHMKAKIAAWESGRDAVCRHAPHLAMAYVEKGNPLARTDAVIALSHLDVLAPSFGLGACWAGIFRVAAESYRPLREALAIPAGYEPVHFLMLGYPDVHYQRPPKRNRAEVVWR
jgi:nitroreductase